MEKIVTVEVPVEWLEYLEWDEADVVQEIIQLGTYQFKVRRALHDESVVDAATAP